LAFAFQPVVVAPPAPPAPPPPVVQVTAPPPIVVPQVVNRPTITVRVRAFAGRALLLQDDFRVGRAPAMYNQSRSEADLPGCVSNTNGWPMARSSVNFSLRADTIADDGYRLTFGWTRPTTGCGSEGTLSVNLERSVILKPGQSMTVDGDGGVRVELTRL